MCRVVGILARMLVWEVNAASLALAPVDIVFIFLFLDYIKDVSIYKIESYFIHLWCVDEIMD